MLKVVRNPRTKLDESLEKTLSLTDRWKRKGTLPEWAGRYAEALSSSFAKPKVTEVDGQVHLYSETGVASRFGVYVTHLSIIIIFIGAIVGVRFGFKGYVNIPEGDSVTQIPVRGGNAMQDLGFTVRCNSFRLETYPSGQPKAYMSDLSVIDGGRETLRKTIVVNDPLQYKGIWFYQSSYGQAGGATAKVAVARSDGTAMGGLALGPNEPVPIDGYGIIRGVNYEENYQGNGPALQVVVEKPGQLSAAFWLLQRRPDLDRQRADSLVFSFGGLSSKMFTGLQVAKDPGVNIVWLGCALMVIGLIMAFFLSHQRIWIRLAQGTAGRVEVVLAGSSSRNRLAFEKRFEKLQTGVKAAGQ
jgi:cytochrome c biogenesis protein